MSKPIIIQEIEDKAEASLIGAANGLAQLGSNSKILNTQMPWTISTTDLEDGATLAQGQMYIVYEE